MKSQIAPKENTLFVQRKILDLVKSICTKNKNHLLPLNLRGQRWPRKENLQEYNQ